MSPRDPPPNTNPNDQWSELTVGVPSRLDHFLRTALPHLSRRILSELIAAGRTRLNGSRAHKGSRVRPGDRVQVGADLLAVTCLRPQTRPPLAIIYVDDHLVAIDKPCGMPSVAQNVLEVDTAANFLIGSFPETAALDRLEAGFVHRLDTATSGVLLAARSSAAHSDLRAAFRRRDVVKRYCAMVDGAVHASGICRGAIRNKPGDPRRVEVVDAGLSETARAAETQYRPVARFGTHTLLEVEIHSGARHQVRAHLAALGHPITGDDLYGGSDADRLMLHAAEIELAHPMSGAAIVIAARPAPFARDLG